MGALLVILWALAMAALMLALSAPVWAAVGIALILGQTYGLQLMILSGQKR